MELWNRMVEDQQLVGLTRPCPDCECTLSSTGRMFYSEYLDQWYVEYRCPGDGELYPIYTEETDALARQIVKKIEASRDEE